MRALWLPGVLLACTLLAAVASAQVAQPQVQAPGSVSSGSTSPQGGVPQPTITTNDPTNAAPTGGQGNLPASPPVDVGKALQPDLGSGIYFTIGVGVSLLGLAAASLLGTKFVTNENVLENDARRAIFEYIKTNPGCHLRETAGALQLSTTNVLWHLRKLEEANLVNGKKLEGYKVFYPVEGGVEAKRMGLALAVLRNPNARQVLGTIARNPGIHQREIARLLTVNHGTVRWHLKKLGIVQLVLEVKKGAISMYYVSALGLHALERVEATPAMVAQPPPLVEALAPAQAVGAVGAVSTVSTLPPSSEAEA
jgi:predicted transcriptional regulator